MPVNMKPLRTRAVPFLIKELYKRSNTHWCGTQSPWQQHINSPKPRATQHRLLKHTPLSVIYKQTHAPSYYSKGSVHTCTCLFECSTVNNGAEGFTQFKKKKKSHSGIQPCKIFGFYFIYKPERFLSLCQYRGEWEFICGQKITSKIQQ